MKWLRSALFLPGIFLLTGCNHSGEADFGCKAAAVYGNYDSAVRLISKSEKDPEIREKLNAKARSGCVRKILRIRPVRSGRNEKKIHPARKKFEAES